MRILLIPDKFKGSLTARQVIRAIRHGIKKSNPKTEIFSVIASDGGDGFLNSVAENISCQEIFAEVEDPLGRKINAVYLIDRGNDTAYIELAKTSGLELLARNERLVMATSTYGTGMQINHAIQNGAKKIYVGLGGSATNDGGMGIAAALGYSFMDGFGNELEPIGENLIKVRFLKKSEKINLKDISIFAVNDVDNPLFGKRGAAHFYAGQKGADAKEIVILDKGLKQLSKIVEDQIGVDASEHSGSGAAGGTAYGLKVFLNAEFITGIDFVLNLAHVEELLEKNKFDYIITGEGKFDDQTLHGKLIKGVLNVGKKHSVPVVVLCGQADVNKTKLDHLGLEEILEIRDTSKPLHYSIENAAELIALKIYNFLENRI